MAIYVLGGHNIQVNVVTVELVRRRDHKLYPLGLPRPPAEHLRIVALSHTLRCGRKLAYRQAEKALAAEFGIRRSIGAVYRDVHDYRCPLCTPRPAPPPDPRMKARAVPWRWSTPAPRG